MIKFYEKRKIYFSISIFIMVVGLISLFVRGVNLDIQFKGGAIIKYTYTGEMDIKKVETLTKDTLKRNVNVQSTTDIATGEKNLVLNLAGNEGMSATEQGTLDTALKEAFKTNDLKLSSSNIVEPFIGQRFLRNGFMAIALSSLLIVIYVWFRFKSISGLSAGVMALVALLHDCLVVFFTFVIFNLPINDAFVAIILTIIGYSINDTIVVYDRIRENKNAKGKWSLEDLVNTSITQSITRSVNTAATTVGGAIIIFVFAYIYGIESIVIFALPMAVGLISGCYSTICIAGPLWVMWQKHSQNKRLKGSKA